MVVRGPTGIAEHAGAFPIDMRLPAFHAIGDEFSASPIAVQQTLSTYMFAYAFMMLWHGALSDALGRRPVVIAGLSVYALAALGCAISGNIQSLWPFRTLQGLSAGRVSWLGARSYETDFTVPKRSA